jgi:type I restriction enzyme S subunit
MLKDVAEIIMGQSPAGEDCNRECLGLPLLNGPTEFGPSYPQPTQFTTDPKKQALPGDLLFCVRGSTTGRMNWADQEYAIGRGIAAIRHRLSPKLQPLVRAAIEHHLPVLLQAATGSTFPNVSGPQLAGIPFPNFTPSEAVAVAATLGALDEKIELNRRMNETLEAMARAIFKDWFVDFGPTRAKMEGRAPYLAADIWSLFPDRLDDDGKPEGWHMIRLEQILTTLETGGRPKGGVSSYRSGVPSVGAESITRLGEFDFSKTKYVPEEFFRSMKKGHVKSRDVLLYKDGGKPGLFEPHVTLFGDSFPFPRFAINEHVYRMRVNENFGQNCLYFWLSTDSAKAEMRIKGTGVAIPGLNSTQLRSLSVILPSNGIAKRLDQILEPLVTRVLANCCESRTLAAVRDFLLPKLMSGQIRVKNAENLAGEAT